jgi:hypothetical protein
MPDIKQFLFLSKTQKILVSVVLLISFVTAIALIYLSKKQHLDPDFKTLGIDLVKMTLTASAAWVTVLLYASSNSYERINKESGLFLKTDVTRAFQCSGYKISISSSTSNQAIYKVEKENLIPLLFLCRLSLTNIEFLAFLPKTHAKSANEIYKNTLDYWEINSVKISNYGVNQAVWRNEKNVEYLEISGIRDIPPQFLFDAGHRSHYADSILGDAKSFITNLNKATV